MTPDRFRQLTEAYGAAPERWPQAERAEAEALLAQGDPAALAALAEAHSLDLMLAADALAAPDADLARRIVASAPSPKLQRQKKPAPRAKRTRWWLSGAGFVGSGMAGIAAGVLAISLTGPLSVSATSPSSVFDETGTVTVFNSATPDWSDQ
jgi:hypothetical protein